MTRPNWFVALPVRAPGALASLRAPEGVRLFAEQDLHATLAFFGPVAPEVADAAWRTCELTLAPRSLTLGAVVPLGASALSACVDDPAIAAEMSRVRGPLLARAGAPPEARAPLVHVTLARVERRATDAQRRDAIAWARDVDLARVPASVDRVALYSWALDRRERLFRLVDERPLALEAAPGERRP